MKRTSRLEYCTLVVTCGLVTVMLWGTLCAVIVERSSARLEAVRVAARPAEPGPVALLPIATHKASKSEKAVALAKASLDVFAAGRGR